ncbi:MAG: alanine racemase [Candidatus Melainabacteria bacterium]|nr:alanine racemase [Candidatus Melainabacteria bacterium]
MKSSRQLPTQPHRDAWVEINLGALERNARRLRAALPSQTNLMAVVKADAYGHGAVMVLPVLQAAGFSMAGVASVDEAVQLREAGVELPILVLGGVPDWSMEAAVEYDLRLTVFTPEHLEGLMRLYRRTQRPVRVHVKVDTGMNRVGVSPTDALKLIEQCQQTPAVVLEGIFSHLASPNDAPVLQQQWTRWQSVLRQVSALPPCIHLANSSGAFALKDLTTAALAEASNPPPIPSTMVRIGLSLFGYNETQPAPILLEAVMGLKARIVHVHEVPAGEGVSYGHRYHTQRPSRIATLPLGYADGIPRCLSNRIDGLLRGVAVPQVGTITMDQLMLDVTDVPEVRPGEAVTLLGSETTASGQRLERSLSGWATLANTIEYELMCGLRVRLPRTYTRL